MPGGPAVIVPPRDARAVIDKTAEFVARGGAEFEEKILAEEAGNAQFSFIRFEDPYRAYYDKKLAELRAGQASPPSPAAEQTPAPPAAEEELQGWVPHPPLPLAELEGLKLAARAVTLHGPQFYEQLLEGHATGALAFLRPSHRLFAVFTALVEHYALVVEQLPALRAALEAERADPQAVLRRCALRLERHALEFEEQKRALVEDRAQDEEQVPLDWDNFVVLKTIEWDAQTADTRFPERLPPPSVPRAPPQPRKQSAVAPTADSVFYKCTFCGQSVRLEEYEAHHRAEIARARPVDAPPRESLAVGSRDPAAFLAHTRQS